MADIAVVGAGLIGQKHIALMSRAPGCRLAAIIDPTDHARRLAAAEGVVWFSNLEDYLNSNKPEGVIVAAPTSLHVPLALLCIRYGVPVLLEKPIAGTYAEAEQLVKAAEQNDAILLIGQHRRHNPIIATTRKIVQAGQLGRLVAIQGAATFYKPDRYYAEGLWRTVAGGGPILLNMTHEIDNLRFICGEISSVQAIASSSVRNFAVEDTAVINFRFENGALGSFVVSDATVSVRSWEQTSRENSDYPSYSDENCYHFMGDAGSLDVPTMRFTRATSERSWWKPVDRSVIPVLGRYADDAYVYQLEHFSAVIKRELPPIITGRDALQTLRVTLAVQEFISTGNVTDCLANIEQFPTYLPLRASRSEKDLRVGDAASMPHPVD